MTLLIDINNPEWMTDKALKEVLCEKMPGIEVVCYDESFDADKITMMATSDYRAGSWRAYPNLKLIQKLGAGVDIVMADKSLPEHIMVTRIRSEVPAVEIAQYCLTYVLCDLRNVRGHFMDQMQQSWRPVAPKPYQEKAIAVLGLGTIGLKVAELFKANGFEVRGWSRSKKELHGIHCFHGMDSLNNVLEESDYVCSILPSTDETVNLFGANRFVAMKSDGVLINAGRGDLVNESDLVAALDAGELGGAVLDVTSAEPLPSDSLLWQHEKITITPHVSGWNLGDALGDVAANYERLKNSDELLNKIDRTLGY